MDTTREHSFQYTGISGRFWADEEPEILRTTYNVFRFYRQSNILSVSLPDFLDYKTNQPRIGKTIAVSLTALGEEPEVLNALLEILKTACLTSDTRST